MQKNKSKISTIALILLLTVSAVLIAFLSGQLLTIMTYFLLPEKNIFTSIITILIISVQLSYLKTMVAYYEEKKRFGVFRRYKQ